LEYLTVDDGVVRISVSGDFSPPAFSGAPQTAYSVTYNYSGCREAPISDVSLWLTDYVRKLSVTGRSADQVQVLTSVATEDLTRFESSLGGPMFRIVGSAILLVLIWLVPLLLLQNQPVSRRKVFALLGAWLAVFLSLAIFPWSKWFGGTAVYSGDASFLRRNEAVVSFLGLVVTVAAFISSMWYSKRRESAPPPTVTTKKAKPSQGRTE